MSRRALITGITGQDGSYLAELLLAKGYEVHGIIRRSSSFNTARIDHIFHDLHLHYGDVTDAAGLAATVAKVMPDEVYNLAAQSHVRVSFDCPAYTQNVVALGTMNLLEAVRAHCPTARMYQAGSSEMFGLVQETPQNEKTPFYPRSPYSAAKVCAHWSCVNYRESYGLHVSNGILFNHESPRRGETFVTRKITRAATRIYLGLQERLVLGNLESKRDWGFAGDYVNAMWLMLQQNEPDDYVIATGLTYSVSEFLERVFKKLNISLDRVGFDPRYTRPAEVDLLLGDPTKARENLGWHPETDLDGLIDLMIAGDLKLARAELAAR